MPKYIIVKHADSHYWPVHFVTDPSKGVHGSFSIHTTPTGKSLNIKDSYNTIEEANVDLQRAIKDNPCVGYEVCPIIQYIKTL